MVKCKTKKRQGVKEESERERTVKELPQKQRGGEAKKKGNPAHSCQLSPMLVGPSCESYQNYN